METGYNPMYDLDYLNFTDLDYTFPESAGGDDISNWTIAGCIIAGIGILSNCILLLFLFCDIVFDSRMRTWSRHLLLGYHALMLVVMLTCFTTTSALSLAKARYGVFFCKLLTQLRVAPDYAIAFSGVLLTYNVFANVYIPESLIGKKQIIFWSVLIGISWSISQILAFVFHTRHMQMVGVESISEGNGVYSVDYQSYCLDTLKDHAQRSVSYVTCSLIPFGLSVTMALVSVVGLCIAPPRTNLSKEPLVMSVLERRTSSAVFGFIFVLFSLAYLIPATLHFFTQFVNTIAASVSNKTLFLILNIPTLIFSALFPLITLVLREIRAIPRNTLRNRSDDVDNTATPTETNI